jgi:SAM-dependent methyltransferase
VSEQLTQPATAWPQSQGHSVFVCPDCRGGLRDRQCTACGRRFAEKGGIPVLLPSDPVLQSAADIGAVYDDIYEHRSKVWENQGRTDAFIGYFAGLVGRQPVGRLLEIGCGEGFLLAKLPARERVAIDLSAQALGRASGRVSAQCAVALAERLPFPDASFDAVCSVGVMEHFLDEHRASAEIARVLKPGGRYVVLIHVARTRSQELAQKVREYLWPIPRPVALTRWIAGKLIRPVHQPIQLRFTVASARECLERGGLMVSRTITTESEPDAPLVGPHVVIYDCVRRDGTA